MPLHIIRQDITAMKCDAIVNAANNTLLGGGGVDGAIHRAAGPELLEECRKIGGCPTGEARVTKAYKLPCRYVIHTVGPVWNGGGQGEEQLLRSCYRNSLALAEKNNCESIAFPLISSGIYGYPKAQALNIAVSEISAFLVDHDVTVYITVFDKDGYKVSEKLFTEVESYVDDKYVDLHTDDMSERIRASNFIGAVYKAKGKKIKNHDEYPILAMDQSIGATLDDRIKMIDESFTEMLLRKIDESGMTDAECYKKANIDRKLFSKIRKDKHYRPSKPTAIAFAIALKLSLEDTKELLMKAGFSLSHSSKFDIIIEYFIENNNYNIHEINEILFQFDQMTLGVEE